MALTKKQRVAIIDRYGELKRRVAEFKPVSDEASRLEKQIVSWYDEEPATSTFVEEGEYYSVQIGQKKNERTIVNMGRIFALLGRARFLELCSFPLAVIDKSLPDSVRKVALHEDNAGDRSINPVAKVTPMLRKVA